MDAILHDGTMFMKAKRLALVCLYLML